MSPQPCVWYHGLEWEPAQQHHRPWQLLLRACSTHPRLFAEPYRAVLRDRAPGLTRTSMHLVWIQSWMGERYAWQKFLDFFSLFFWLYSVDDSSLLVRFFFGGWGVEKGFVCFIVITPSPAYPNHRVNQLCVWWLFQQIFHLNFYISVCCQVHFVHVWVSSVQYSS